MKFEWDTNKEKINIQKCGITFEQASYVFADPFALSKYDDEHSEDDEDRWVLLEKSLSEVVCIPSEMITAQSLSESSVPEERQKERDRRIIKGVRNERRV